MKSARIIAGMGLLLAASSVLSASAPRDQWPARPVRMIVPFSPGAASDVLSRIVGQRLSETYGQQFVADNRPGAGGLIGSQLIRSAAPDGYTIGIVGQPHLSNTLMRDPHPYDPLQDFVSISLIAMTPNIIVVGKGVEAKTVPDLIALAKAKPGALNYGSAGVGSSSHIAGALFAAKAGINVVHVPFRIGDSRSALMTGSIQFYIYPLPAIVPLIRSGSIRALAVATPKRVEALPEVPTTAEAGFPQYQSVSWFGMIGPKGLPRALVTRLSADIGKILREPAVRENVIKQGAEPAPGTPEQFAKMQRDEYSELAALIKQTGMKVQ
jgi:tripartite-type tricarboxylate transporter receptor subunit TctC